MGGRSRHVAEHDRDDLADLARRSCLRERCAAVQAELRPVGILLTARSAGQHGRSLGGSRTRVARHEAPSHDGLDVRGSDHPRPRGASRQPAPRDPPRGGDVRARRRHVVDERLDRGGRQGPRHHREWGPIRDRARGAGLRRVHPDREQDRGPDRPQEGLRPGSARLRDRRARDDARAGPHRGHHLLGDHRRSRRVAPAAVDAIPDPRQLRRGRADGRHTPSSELPPRSPPRSDPCSAASSRPTCRGASASRWRS